MKDYKGTLNLPKTNFPMKANLPNREPVILQKWEDIDLYKKIREHRTGSKKFLLHDGPPYANGNIHIGHVLNKTLKDIVVKSRTMSGLDAPFRPGWDCHGLPIELKVEKKLGKPGIKINKHDFRKACREYAATQIDVQRDDFIRLGGLGDWYAPYLSMDYKIEANTIRALAKIVEKGYIKKGNKPVHWCFDCQSSLAEAEVEYSDKTSPSVDVKFSVDSFKNFNIEDIRNHDLPISFVIWTTTPWSLSSNQAVALNPKFNYSIIKINNAELVVVATELINDLMDRWGIEVYEILTDVSAEDLEHSQLTHPFEDRTVPIILSEHVTLDAGTGVVHTAPSHGIDDYGICVKYNIPVRNTVGANGCYLDGVPHFAGIHVSKSTEQILKVLRDKKALLYSTQLQHSYPHCWRHKTPVVYRATSQWFINLEHNNLREKALNVVKNKQWLPNWGMNRMMAMLEGRPDWCISRQERVWGVPMAFVVHKDTGELHPDCVGIMLKVAALIEKDGIDAWYTVRLEDLVVEDVINYYKSNDTLDVWFSSGVTHECVLAKDPQLGLPADLYLEGSDQHRGWFQSSLITSMILHDDAPYKTVLTHGYTVDSSGRKMSKSLGNVVNPEKALKTLGADILRLWVAATDYHKDMSISNEILKRVSEAYRRIRNTLRYLLSNLYDFDLSKNELSFGELVELDQYILYKTQTLQLSLQHHYESYQIHYIYQKIHNFCTVDLGGFYLDIIKDRQYTCKSDSKARRSCQTAIYHIAHSMVRWIAPILSFTAEEMWGYLPGAEEDSVFIGTWYNGIDGIVFNDTDVKFWRLITSIRDECNKALELARNNNIIGAALEAEIILYCNKDILNKLSRIQKELHFIMIASKVSLQELSNAGNQTDLDGLRIDVIASKGEKCVRCWHRSDGIGNNDEYPNICPRCIDNVYNNGESRLFA